MAINYKSIIWNVSEKIIAFSAWNKNDSDEGIRVTIKKDGIELVPETLQLCFKTSGGLETCTEGIIIDGEFNIDLNEVIANQKSSNAFVYLKFSANAETITSPIFSIPISENI